MTEYTAEDFTNARFADHKDGRVASKAGPGKIWHTIMGERMSDGIMAIAGWRPVRESAPPFSLDALREAWENAEQSEGCRVGDTLIEPLAPGSYYVHSAARDYSSLSPVVRILHRAPQQEPWEGLAKVLRTTGVDGQAMDPEILASVLYERGVRVTGGDEK